MKKKTYQKKRIIGPNDARMLVWAVDMVKVEGRRIVWGVIGGSFGGLVVGAER